MNCAPIGDRVSASQAGPQHAPPFGQAQTDQRLTVLLVLGVVTPFTPNCAERFGVPGWRVDAQVAKLNPSSGPVDSASRSMGLSLRRRG
jgi:hypothetical protein